MDFAHDATAWVALSFALFVVLIWFKGRKAILGALDQRIALIRTEIETAENLRAEAQKLCDEYERKYREAVRESENVVKAAEKQSIEIRKQADMDMAETIRIREKQLADRLERMKQSAMDEIQQYAANLAIEATAGIIKEKLDKQTHAQLVDEAIANIGKNLH